MTVAEYFTNLKRRVANHPQIVTYAVHEEVRSPVAGALKARIVFTNGVVLDFREFVTWRSDRIVKLSYSYNCRKQHLLFRYDNSPHHRHLPASQTFEQRSSRFMPGTVVAASAP